MGLGGGGEFYVGDVGLTYGADGEALNVGLEQDVVLNVEQGYDAGVVDEQLFRQTEEVQAGLPILCHPGLLQQGVEGFVDVAGIVGLRMEEQVEEVLRVRVVGYPAVGEL